MFWSTNSIFAKLMLFISIILICIISNSSELHPELKVETLQPNRSSNNDEQLRETTSLKTVTIPLNYDNHKETSPIPTMKEPAASEPNLANIMEGGGTDSAHIPATNHETETEIHKSEHSKGSKGRKGVNDQQSSVVPRKGVDTDQSLINSSVDISKVENNALDPTIKPLHQQLISVSGTANTGNTEQQSKMYSTKHKLLEDPDDDFDKYPWIKSSTTGEDYVIIGIVIIIGIWFSVFGALIFYRRAGEYWDRRHYRRMDFLVEGMYND